MGPEDIVIQLPEAPARQLFLLYHHSGDNPGSMLAAGERIAREFPQAGIISISSPHPLPTGGSEWFSEQEGSATLRQKAIDSALPGFIAGVKQWQTQSGVSPAATALIGFSQGGTMVLEALKIAPALAGRAVILSGRYNTPPLEGSVDTTIHLIHGEEDDVVPVQHAEEAERWIVQSGGDVTLDRVGRLSHGIDESSLDLVVRHLKYTIPKRYFDEALSGGTPGQDDVVTLR